MKDKSFYLSNKNNLDRAFKLTELSLDEIETVVGRFTKNSWRSGELRGEVVIKPNNIVIRHHFTKKVLWRKND